jgi:hypothetical protein
LVSGLGKGIVAFILRKLQESGGKNSRTGTSEDIAEKIEKASDESDASETFYDGLEVLEQWRHIDEDKRRFVQLEIGIVLIKDTRRGFMSRLTSTLSSIVSFMLGHSVSRHISSNNDPDEGMRVVREALRSLSSTNASNDYSGRGECSVTRSDLACQPGELLNVYQQSGAVRSFTLTLKSSELFIGQPHANSMDVRHQRDALRDTLALLDHLQTAFNSAKQNSRWEKYRITTDPSCFVNIHIGNKTEPPTLTHVKNVTKFLLMNESVIDSSHAIHRVAHYNTSNQLVQAQNKSLSSLFNSSTPSLNIGRSPLDWLTFINQQNSITSLQLLCLSEDDPNQHYTLNLYNLYCRADPLTFDMAWNSNLKKGTFEFRQSAGTLNPTELRHRVTFYNAIIDTAERLSSTEMDHLCTRRHPETRSYKFPDLLKNIHCPPETIDYYRRLLRYESIAERSWIPRNVGLAVSWLFAESSAFMKYFVEESEEDRLAAMDAREVLRRVRDNDRKGHYGKRSLLSGFPFL